MTKKKRSFWYRNRTHIIVFMAAVILSLIAFFFDMKKWYWVGLSILIFYISIILWLLGSFYNDMVRNFRDIDYKGIMLMIIGISGIGFLLWFAVPWVFKGIGQWWTWLRSLITPG